MIFGFNVEKIRKDFPILSKGIYLDSACMSLKPTQVVEKMNEYYSEYTGCAGRSAHTFAAQVEKEVDIARNAIRKLINAKEDAEIIFTRNTTEGINLVANTFPFDNGEVIISDKEHNSNLVPWLRLQKKGVLKLVVVDTNEDGTFNIDNFKNALSEKTKLVSVVHTSNMDGVTNPIKEIVSLAHAKGAKVLVDGAQSVPTRPVDVQDLDVDFLSFSGHKMCGPTGTGVLYGKRKELDALDQFMVGGETVMNSTHDDYVPEELPMKFEAGLQDYAGIIGLGAAAAYLKKIGLQNIQKQELKLNTLMTELLKDEEKIELLGPKDPALRSGVFSFNVKGMDPHHVSRMLNASKKIMTRSGAHCVHSWFNKHNMQGSARASLYFYNTEDDVRSFVSELKKIISMA